MERERTSTHPELKIALVNWPCPQKACNMQGTSVSKHIETLAQPRSKPRRWEYGFLLFRLHGHDPIREVVAEWSQLVSTRPNKMKQSDTKCSQVRQRCQNDWFTVESHNTDETIKQLAFWCRARWKSVSENLDIEQVLCWIWVWIKI